MMRQARFETEAIAQAEKDDYEVRSQRKVKNPIKWLEALYCSMQSQAFTYQGILQTRQKLLREQETSRTAKRKQKREKKRVSNLPEPAVL